MTRTLSEDIKKQIYEMGQSDPTLSNKEIARRLNVNDHSVARYRGAPHQPEVMEDGEEFVSAQMHVNDARLIERLRFENTRLRGMNKLLARSGAVTIESIVGQFEDFIRNETPGRFEFSPKVYPKPTTIKSVFDPQHIEIATLVLSDWHCGEVIRPEESNGVNNFNSVVLANRVYTVIDKFKRIVRGHQAMYKFEKIWVPVLGDMLHGSIHPEFVLTNDLLDIPAAILVARLLIMAITELKTLGLPIEIDAVVGNHPRLLPTMPSKRQAHTSLDWMVYKMVEQKFEDDPQVTVRVHNGQFAIIQQFGHRMVIEHGYGAKKDEHLPERIRRMFDAPQYREATGLQGASVDCVVIGDKHRAEVGENYIVNGCLSGAGEYGMTLRLDPIGVIQQFFGISRSHTRTFHYELDAAKVVTEETTNPMSRYAARFLEEHGR